MVNFILVVFCIGIGMLFRRQNLLPLDAHKGINVWVLYVALPAVSFKYIPKIEWNISMLFPVLAVVVVWWGASIMMRFYAKHKGYRRRTRSSLELASGYSNTSFIGFPLVSAYLGESLLSVAIISDQTTFTLLSMAGIAAALRGQSSVEAQFDVMILVRRLLSFPPFVGTVLALTLSPYVDFSVAAPFIDHLAATVAPLALFSVGLQLKFRGWKRQFPIISTALLYKLVLAPLLVLLIALLFGLRGEVAKVAVLEAAMPTLVTTSIIAERYGLNTGIINLIIGVGIVVGLLTTGVWAYFISIWL